MLKVGFISYLNAYPFYYPFEIMPQEACIGWEFTVARPGVLNKMLHDKELDISLVSFMEYASNPDQYEIIKGIGLSSKGYVDSVRLISKKPIEELNGCEIRTTSASATSVAVMEILLKEHGVNSYTCCRYDVNKGIPDCEAALTIGDEALTADTHEFQYSYDLGEIWKNLFNRNIVFAVCAVQKDAVEWKMTDLNSFVRELQNAPKFCQKNRDEFEEACYRRYPDIANPMQYLDRLHFQMEEHEEDDLQFFLRKAYEYKLINKLFEPEYFVPALELASGDF